MYYYNTETGMSQWDKPEGFIEGGQSDEMSAALKIQSLFRELRGRSIHPRFTTHPDTHPPGGNKIRQEVETKMSELQMASALNQKWIEQYDPAQASMYYYNTETGESQWEKPADFVPGGTDEKCTAVLKLQCTWRAKVARRRAAEVGEKKQALKNQWIKEYDPSSGHYYYCALEN